MENAELEKRLLSVISWLHDAIEIGDVNMNSSIIKIVRKIIKDLNYKERV